MSPRVDYTFSIHDNVILSGADWYPNDKVIG
jgi:hypothetical protein